MNALSKQQIDQFIEDGYVQIENAVPEETCAEIREILWNDLGVDRNDSTTWTRPVIRLGFYSHPPFNKAVNMPLLTGAFDQLVGKDRWIPRNSIGTFPVRFPSVEDPGDTGWHVDSSFPGNDMNDFSTWRINVYSKGRALLMLFIFSDIGETDAPTIIRRGSHRDVAKILAPYGKKGLSFMELAGKLDVTNYCEQVLATGKAGMVYLCHPFVVHAAQPNHGKSPRFLAQPTLEMKEDLQLWGNINESSPVEKAIRIALEK